MGIHAFLIRFFEKFFNDETNTLAASLAFYTALSLAPILVLFITIASHFSPDLVDKLVTLTREEAGRDASQAVELVLTGAQAREDLSSIASIIGIGTLLISASLIFGQLRTALNRIFQVRPPEMNGTYLEMATDFVRQRIFQVVAALGFILTLIVSLVASSVISARVQADDPLILPIVNVLVSLGFYIGLFTLMFHFLPDRRTPWPCASKGGALTALLFVIGKELIGMYLGRSAVGSAYGAAGSVIVLLVWVYYSSLITFVGAQVSAILLNIKPPPPQSA